MAEGPLPAGERRLLERVNFATLATLGRDGAPQATVVWFLMEGDEVLVNTREGRSKVSNLGRDPRCALAVFDSDDPYRSVQLRGLAREWHRGQPAGEDIHRLSRRYQGHDYKDPWQRVSYLVSVTSWSSYGF